jgi:hypothetical protein
MPAAMLIRLWSVTSMSGETPHLGISGRPIVDGS